MVSSALMTDSFMEILKYLVTAQSQLEALVDLIRLIQTSKDLSKPVEIVIGDTPASVGIIVDHCVQAGLDVPRDAVFLAPIHPPHCFPVCDFSRIWLCINNRSKPRGPLPGLSCQAEGIVPSLMIWLTRSVCIHVNSYFTYGFQHFCNNT